MSKGPFAGRYNIERVLGSGATATVHLALDTQTGSHVAIKILRHELLQSAATGRFLKEIRRTAMLEHPHILRVLDFGEVEGKPYFVLPYMEGGTLRTKIQRESQLPFEETLSILRNVAEALDYAHDRGLIHRDVKPENILFTGGAACLGDFGIARAFETTFGTGGTTSSDTIRGTYAYMSPEQAAGAKQLDGRSDIYSLACVAYEMITGMQAFIGPTPEVIVAQRFSFAPREVRAYRPSAPPEVDVALAKAFAMSPADRYYTASAFIESLELATKGRSASVERSLTPARLRRKPSFVVAGGVLVLAATSAILAFTDLGIGTPRTYGDLDTSKVVVLPLDRDSSRQPPWRDDDLLQQGLARWSDVHVIDQFQTADAIRRVGAIRSTQDAGDVAASLGAGRYIRGRVSPRGDDWSVSASIYDVARGEAIHSTTLSVPNEVNAAAGIYARLADSLLLRGTAADSAPVAPYGNRSIAAVLAFARGMAGLDAWDLVAADSGFSAAAGIDGHYGRASLWLAQVRAWQNLPTNAWGTIAERASANMSQFTEREKQLATGLSHLAAKRFTDACNTYDQLRSRNDQDFAAWFGLGQCRSLDKVVIRDTLSPSGWRFRSSTQRALAAYTRAFEILPAVHRGYDRGAFERLRMLLLLSTDGTWGQGDTVTFYARPGLFGDTIALIPYPWQLVFSGDPATIPPRFSEALRVRRTAFRNTAIGWSSAYPQSPVAKYAVAIALELLEDPLAIDTIRVGRRLASDDRRRAALLAASEVLLLAKFGAGDRPDMLRRAAALSDSLLASRSTNLIELDRAAGLAALMGRCALGEELARQRLAVTPPRVPAWMAIDAQALLVRVTLGCQSDSSSSSVRSVAALIEREYRTDLSERRRTQQLLLSRAVALQQPLDSSLLNRLVDPADTSTLLAVVHRASVGQNAVAARWLRRLESNTNPEIGYTPDVALQIARLWLTLGDSASASRSLDKALEQTRRYSPDLLSEPGTAAMFVMAMVLRADLANAARDASTARRWARAVTGLWSTSDDHLKPTLQRMSQYAASPGTP